MKVAVLYADGSAIRNPGICGYGVFGYLYDTETVGKPYVKDDVVTLATGFSDHRVDQQVIPSFFVEAYGNFDPKVYPKEFQTNNLAELSAVNKSLDIALERNVSKVYIYSDSTYAVNSLLNIGYIHNKHYRKSDGNEYKSKKVLQEMHDKYKASIANNLEINISWIKGHKGFFGNEQADMFAGIASRKSKKREYLDHLVYKTLKDYKSLDKTNRPDLLCYPRLYFNTQTGAHTPGYYFMASYVDTKADQFYLGKKSSDSIFALVKLRSSCKEVEDIIYTHQNLEHRYNKLVRLDVNSLFNKETSRLYNDVGRYSFMGNYTNYGYASVSSLGGTSLTVDEIPSCLSYKAIDVCNELASILGPYMRGEDLGSDTTIMDITSCLYKREKKGIKLKAEYVNSSVPIAIDKLNIKIEFRYNLPDRNIMKRLEEKEVKVYYGRRMSGDLILFDFTIIDCIDGIVLTSNRYARRLNEIFHCNK